MKNVMKTMMVIGVFALFAFAPVNVKEVVATPTVEPVEEVCVEEEALYCSVTTENGSASCWFCNCKELIESMQ